MVPVVFLLHPAFWAYAYNMYQHYYPYNYPQGMTYPMAPPAQAMYPMAGYPYMYPSPPPPGATMTGAVPPTSQQDYKQYLLQMKQHLADELKKIEEALSAIDKAGKGK